MGGAGELLSGSCMVRKRKNKDKTLPNLPAALDFFPKSSRLEVGLGMTLASSLRFVRTMHATLSSNPCFAPCLL